MTSFVTSNKIFDRHWLMQTTWFSHSLHLFFLRLPTIFLVLIYDFLSFKYFKFKNKEFSQTIIIRIIILAHALLYTFMSITMFIFLSFSFSVSPNNKHEYIILKHVHITLKTKGNNPMLD